MMVMMTSSTLKDNRTEHAIQSAFVTWWSQQTYPGLLFAIPNGGWRSKATAIKLKVEGVSRGVPDLFVPQFGLWIEMKRIKGGRLSPEQKDWITYLEEAGNAVLVCYGHEHAIQEIDAFMAQRLN